MEYLLFDSWCFDTEEGAFIPVTQNKHVLGEVQGQMEWRLRVHDWSRICENVNTYTSFLFTLVLCSGLC